MTAPIVCAVTGASSGIGASAAEELARRGAAVLGLSRRFPDPGRTPSPEPGRVTPVHLDVTDSAAVNARFAGLERLDVLINAAGSASFGRVLDIEPEALRAMLDVFAVGAHACSAQAARIMQRSGGGRIIDIDSIAATEPLDGSGGYGAAKAAQRALARALARELSPHGIAVTSVVLGAVDTPMWDSRPEFDRADMLSARDIATAIADIATGRTAGVREIVMVPAAGTLAPGQG